MTGDLPIVQSRSPLSPMQQGMLFHSQIAPGAGIYIEQLIVYLHEPWNPAAFTQAWMELCARHPVFRTALARDDSSLQEVHSQASLPIVEFDWRPFSPSEQEARFEAWLEEDRRIGFQLTQPPLHRVTLIRRTDDAWCFVWTFHHALLDGRSIVLLIREWFAQYEAEQRGQKATFPEPLPFHSHLEWLHAQDFRSSREYWRNTLSGWDTPISFPAIGGQRESRRSASLEYTWNLVEPLAHFAQQHHLTIHTLIQAAWAFLLGRISRVDDVVFGSVRSGRRSSVPNAEAMIGILINTVPVRIQLPPDQTILDWLKAIRAQQLAVRPHEHTPLSLIQEWSAHRPDQPLFDCLLAFESDDLNEVLRKTGAEWETRSFDLREQAHFPLTLNVTAGTALRVRATFNEAVVSRETLHAALHRIGPVLQSFLANPETKLSELSLLVAEEEHTLLHEWNQASIHSPVNQSLHGWFESQVEKTPDAIAITDRVARLTYQQLNARANQLAHGLRNAGLGPGNFAGLCFERSADLVVAILAILKTGAAYVPCDPRLPAERIAFILQDSGARILITDGNVSVPGIEIFHFDSEKIVQFPDTNPGLLIHAEETAYLIYTSGST